MTVEPRVLEFANMLEAASGLAVTFVLDGQSAPLLESTHESIRLTNAGCEALGLFCPPDFTWRCGDYAFYAARKRFPDVAFFWIIEYDVRFAGGDAEEFFAFFSARNTVDLLAAYFQPVQGYWHWERFARSRDHHPYRCLFPVVRLSSRAIDALFKKRVQHSRQFLRRVLWPNDESFVGTTLANGGFSCHDLNDFGRIFYHEETFSFHSAIQGESFFPDHAGLKVYHPVLFGEAYLRKLAVLKSYETPRRDPVQATLARKLNRFTKW
jgi:hypothetical protein